MVSIITYSPEQTIDYAKSIGSLLKGGEIIAYKGEMGVGKTTFTRGLAIGMGLDDDVTSPTFALVNEYTGCHLNLCHFDMYRISQADEVETTGFYDYMSNTNVLAVEWSENIEQILPRNTVYITITRIDDDTRKIDIDGGGLFENTGA